MARTEFSRKTRRLAWERANGMCEGRLPLTADEARKTQIGLTEPTLIIGGKPCNFPIDLGLFHYDHIIPDWMGGDASLDNCQVLCRLCHAKKTAADVGAIAKVRRIRDRRSKSLTSKRPMPFGRGSKFKRKIDGRIVER